MSQKYLLSSNNIIPWSWSYGENKKNPNLKDRNAHQEDQTRDSIVEEEA